MDGGVCWWGFKADDGEERMVGSFKAGRGYWWNQHVGRWMAEILGICPSALCRLAFKSSVVLLMIKRKQVCSCVAQ